MSSTSLLCCHRTDRPCRARTSKLRILKAEYGDHKLVLTAEGLAGSEGVVSVIRHNGNFVPKVKPNLAQHRVQAFLSAVVMPIPWGDPLILNLPRGEGWKTITVTLTW